MNADKRRFNFKTYPIKHSRFIKIFLLGFLLFLPLTIFSKTLAKYRGNIREAKLSVQNLLSPDVEDQSFQDYEELERATVTQIRADVPVSEKIEWQNSTFETNNQWLSDKLDKFEKAPPDDDKRWDILTEINERLGAIEGKLYELENPSISNRSKDEDKQKLAEILRREEYQKPEKPEESFFQKKERIILGERLAANETSANLFSEAENLARQGNLRGAIRKGYIALLCELSERKIIGLSQHKTNRDYLRDVRKQNELYKNMSGLTNNYERHWYGFEDAQAKDWEEFRKDYQKAVNTRN